MCKIEIIKYGLLYCDLLYTLRIGVFDGFLSYKKTIVIMESTTEKRNISMLYLDEAKKGMMAGFIFSLFILLLFSFVSCDKDEDTSFEETPYYLGYFEGKVNSQDISIANQSNSHSFIDHGNFWQEVNTDLSGFYWEIPLGVHISDYPYPMLRISLIPLREGEYLIDKGKLLNEEIESTVRITKDDAKIVYHPLKSSFRIQVDSIRFHEGSGTPYIEGKMEGILYNIENSEDSIVIKDAIFGIH